MSCNGALVLFAMGRSEGGMTRFGVIRFCRGIRSQRCVNVVHRHKENRTGLTRFSFFVCFPDDHEKSSGFVKPK